MGASAHRRQEAPLGPSDGLRLITFGWLTHIGTPFPFVEIGESSTLSLVGDSALNPFSFFNGPFERFSKLLVGLNNYEDVLLK